MLTVLYSLCTAFDKVLQIESLHDRYLILVGLDLERMQQCKQQAKLAYICIYSYSVHAYLICELNTLR